MGILDDAIREHLELKRMHGASEEELRLQEVEALGSPRREPDDADSDGPRGGRGGGADAPLARPRNRWPANRRRLTPSHPLAEELESEPDLEPEPLAVPSRSPSPSRSRSRAGPAAADTLPEGSRPWTQARSLPEEPGRGRRRRRRPAGGHARLPPGDAGARPALVRAEAAARLRFRLDERSRLGGEPRRKLRRGSPAPATPALMQLSGVPCRLCSTEPSMPSWNDSSAAPAET